MQRTAKAKAAVKLLSGYFLFVSILIAAAASQTLQQEVPAGEIVSKVKAGINASYDNVSVIGDIDLRNIEAEERLQITNSHLAGVNLAGSSFAKSVDFSESTFSSDVDLSRAKLSNYAGFAGASFEKNASFEETEFPESDFTDASLLGYSDFTSAVFGDYASFNGALLSNATFNESQFEGVADFCYSVFDSRGEFFKSSFSDVALFKNVEFTGGARFELVSFSDIAAFTSAEFGDRAVFISSRFRAPTHFGTANFSADAVFQLAQFDNLAHFIGSNFSGDLNLMSSKIANIKLENTTFAEDAQILLKDSDFTKFQTHWNHIKNNLAYDGAAYLKLVKNYKDLEWFSDSDDCYYQYRVESQNMKGWGLSKISDMLACISCGYGVRPFNPVYCSLALIVVCTGILWRGNGLRSPAHMEKRTELFDALYYCLAVFFTIPLPDLKPQGRFRYVAVFERSLAWTLFALLIATMGKVMIR
jgi:uncharacterized protein YjbI with pentapeptide repeats